MAAVERAIAAIFQDVLYQDDIQEETMQMAREEEGIGILEGLQGGFGGEDVLREIGEIGGHDTYSLGNSGGDPGEEKMRQQVLSSAVKSLFCRVMPLLGPGDNSSLDPRVIAEDQEVYLRVIPTDRATRSSQSSLKNKGEHALCEWSFCQKDGSDGDPDWRLWTQKINNMKANP